MSEVVEKDKPSLPDHLAPRPPYYLSAKDLFIERKGLEVFVKKIFSLSPDIPDRGPVIMAPGLATNANIFRISDTDDFLGTSHNRAFANLLASEGFTVYLYHPGYAERTFNRYVSKYCRESIHYGKRYEISEGLDFLNLVENEVPLVVELVASDYRFRMENLSWIGYSLGGLLIYSYLSKYPLGVLKNVVTIGSPITLSQVFIRVVPYADMFSSLLGFEETAFLGMLSKNLVPITRLIRSIPSVFVQYNPLTFFLCNPLNITAQTLKILMGKIAEPIPSRLEQYFSEIILSGAVAKNQFTNYLGDLHKIRKAGKNFLFFFGVNDMLAPPDSVFLAHEIISPENQENLIAVPQAGHLDLVVGKNSLDRVWRPTLQWLKEKTASY